MSCTSSEQWMLSIAVRPDGNKLFISWLDRRNDTNNSLVDVYGRWASIATNGTVTFFTNDFRITTESFPPAYGGSLTVNTNIGYYDPVWPPIDANLHLKGSVPAIGHFLVDRRAGLTRLACVWRGS